jgi:hypothetical protein
MYYPVGMVQPKSPPQSVRFGEARLAKIDAYAARRGITRHAAVLEMVDLCVDGRVSVMNVGPTKTVPLTDKGGEPVRFGGIPLHVEAPAEPKPVFKTRLKGEWTPPGGKKR